MTLLKYYSGGLGLSVGTPGANTPFHKLLIILGHLQIPLPMYYFSRTPCRINTQCWPILKTLMLEAIHMAILPSQEKKRKLPHQLKPKNKQSWADLTTLPNVEQCNITSTWASKTLTSRAVINLIPLFCNTRRPPRWNSHANSQRRRLTLVAIHSCWLLRPKSPP